MALKTNNNLRLKDTKNLKLHLGCGTIKISGFINVDIDKNLSAVDVIDNAKELSNFPDNCASLIYACHVLEHFTHDEVRPVLRRWLEVLEPGGELRISVPDLDRIVRVYSKNWEHFQTPPNSPWIGLIYGGQGNQYDYHKTGFNFVFLKYLLEQAGYVEIKEYPHAPHWLGIEDASLANEPFKEYISVNVKAKKPYPSLKTSKLGDSRLSLLHTVEFYHPHIGGAETVVQQISERLAKRGHRVEVATTKLHGRDFRELNGVAIHEFDISGNLANGIRGSDIQRYKEFLMKQPVDVMMNYAAQQWATDLAYSVLEPTRDKRVNVIAPCGYSALKDARTTRRPEFAGYFQKIIPYAVPLYDAAVYHSAVYKDYEFAQLHGFQNSVIIPNGVDEEEFSAELAIDFRNKYEIKTKYMGLCVGNFFSGKGQDRVIECVRQMNLGDFTAVLIGKQGDQLYQFKQQAAGLPVKFLVDIPRKDTVAAFHAADIFLFGSYVEASPLVILEAKASRTPFVSTDCGNVREWKGGIVCAPEEMAENANKLLNNETLRNRMAEEGFNEWKEKLTWKAVVDQYEDLYLRLHHARKKKKCLKVPLKLSKKRASTGNEEAALLKKLQKDFRNIPALVRLAEIEQRRSNHKKAQKYIVAALSLEPQNAAAKTMWEKLHQ